MKGALMDAPPDDAVKQVETQLSVLFVNGRRAVRGAARSVHPDLQPSGLFLLRMLEKSGPLRPSVVADHLDVDRSAISRMIASTEGLGLIERLSDPDDKRACKLALTEEGTMRISRLSWPTKHTLQEWEPDELWLLARLLERLNDDMR